jgi:WD40 repeat protein
MSLKWKQKLAYLVNSVAISKDASRVVAGSYYYPYPGTTSNVTEGTYGTYCFDSSGNQIWKNEYDGNEGIYNVAISGNGQVAAGGGLLTGGRHADPGVPDNGVIRAFDASNGNVLLNFTNFRTRTNSVSLSEDGSVLAGATLGGDLYVFFRQGASYKLPPARPIQAGQRLDCVVVHPSGQWLVACGQKGKVHLITLANGAVSKIYSWTAPAKPEFWSCALSVTGEWAVVGGRNKVYLLSKDSMKSGHNPVAQYDTPNGGTSEDVRWVAMSADGSFITVVQNLGFDEAGLLLGLTNKNNQLSKTWKRKVVSHNPNSTSIDAAGKYVTVADGHPIGTPGSFYLFRASDGAKLWEYDTPDMNWPMVISADGTAAVAGGDDSFVYYFLP